MLDVLLDKIIEVDVIESWWDYLLGILTMILAGVNVWLIYIIYQWQHKDTNEIEERQRKVNQFNNIFLIPRMSILKETFDKLIQISSGFEKSTDDEIKKTEINEILEKKIVEFDNDFVSFITGIDSKLYNEVHKIVEDMRDGLSHDIFDTNTTEITGAAYVQKIQTRINTSYKALIKTLFSYDGNVKDSTEKNTKNSNTILFIMLGTIIILLGSIVYHNYTTKSPEKIIFQLDSIQMKTFVDAVQNDTIIDEANTSVPFLNSIE